MWRQVGREVNALNIASIDSDESKSLVLALHRKEIMRQSVLRLSVMIVLGDIR